MSFFFHLPIAKSRFSLTAICLSLIAKFVIEINKSLIVYGTSFTLKIFVI